jgi:microcystin-dependent protein
MKRLDLYTGGHPLRLDDITHLQSGIIDVLKGICDGIGLGVGTYILSGCNITDSGTQTTVSPGYIYHNGIIYPFDGITYNNAITPGFIRYWFIEQQVLSPSPVTYQDGNTQNVHIRERFNIGYSNTPPPNYILFQQIRRLRQVVGITPQYGIIMYSGLVSNFTTNGLGKSGTPVDGWALCNGNTFSLVGGGTVTTPDLRGRFIVGYHNTDTDYNTIGNVGGSKTHTLTVNEMPAHTHGMGVRITGVTMGASSGNSAVSITGSNTNPTDSTGGGQPHENRPPFYTLAFIMKLY